MTDSTRNIVSYLQPTKLFQSLTVCVTQLNEFLQVSGIVFFNHDEF